MRARPVLVGSAVLALVLGACGTDVPKLPGQLAASGNAKGESTAMAADSMMRANVKYVLGDGVKAGATTGKAYQLPDASKAAAEKLAKAFGVKGDVRAEGESGWSAGQGFKEAPTTTGTTLFVSRSGGSFSLSSLYPLSGCAVPPAAAAPDAPNASSAGSADSVSSAPACRTDEPMTTTTVPPVDAPTKAEAQKIATDALEAGGVNLHDPRVSVESLDGAGFSVRFQPTFDGEAVDGYEASVNVDNAKAITNANGYLGDPKSVGNYDLATLQRSVDRLNESMVAVPYVGNGENERLAATDMATTQTAVAPTPGGVTSEPVPEGGGVPVEPTVIKLTKADVGLMLQGDSKGALWLVPAYRFTSDGGERVTAAAAADKYIERPSTDTTGAVSGGGSSGTSASGSTSGSSGGGVSTDPGATDGCAGVSPSSADANGISAQVCASSTTVKAGENVVFTITASDPDRAFTDGPCADGVTEEFGDGGPGSVRCQACAASVADGGGKVERKREHTYSAPGTYTATFTITSGTMCTKNAKDSTAVLDVAITVV